LLDVIDFEEREEKREDLKMLLDQAQFQVSVLEDQLKVAIGEIKFLRGELSSTQLELMSSRSEIKVLLEELSTYKSGEESKEEFPDLLLSSLDKLYNDKQQQLWLITGIHNSIENSSFSESFPTSFAEKSCDTLDSDCKLPANKEYSQLVPNMSNLSLEPGTENAERRAKKPHPSLTLELTKSYDFNPTAASWNKRSLTTPSSMLPLKYQSWTPTTPTPCSALRPSLSLHNLASKSFTEVLVPSIKPPANHQVTPPQSASPKSPRFSPSVSDQKFKKPQTASPNFNRAFRSSPSVPKKIIKSTPTFFNDSTKCKTSAVKHSGPLPPRPSRKKNIHQTKPQTLKSPKNIPLRPYTSLSSLSEISETLTFLECKKEISV